MPSIDTLLEHILTSTYEADVLHHRLELWQSLLEKHVFSSDAETGDAHDALRAALARAASEEGEIPEHVEAVEGWIREMPSLTREEVHEVVSTVKKRIQELPTLTLTLAIDLPRNERERLGGWAREHVHPQALLDLRVSSSMLGGVIIVWQNNETDMAVRMAKGQSRKAIMEALGSAKTKHKDGGQAKVDQDGSFKQTPEKDPEPKKNDETNGREGSEKTSSSGQAPKPPKPSNKKKETTSESKSSDA